MIQHQIRNAPKDLITTCRSVNLIGDIKEVNISHRNRYRMCDQIRQYSFIVILIKTLPVPQLCCQISLVFGKEQIRFQRLAAVNGCQCQSLFILFRKHTDSSVSV